MTAARDIAAATRAAVRARDLAVGHAFQGEHAAAAEWWERVEDLATRVAAMYGDRGDHATASPFVTLANDAHARRVEALARAADPCPDCGQGWPDGCAFDCPSRDE